MLLRASSVGAKSLFLVAPSKRDRRFFRDVQSCPYNVHTLEPEGFEYLKPSEHFDVERYLDQCRDYIRANPIDGILYSHDISVLFASRLGEEFKFPAPSVESVFLATHKRYSRLQERVPIKSVPINIWNDVFPSEITYPCYVKPPLLVFSKFQRIIESEEELKAFVIEARNILPKWNQLYYNFFEGYVDLSRYEDATADMLLVEEIIRMPQFCVEGYSIGGEVHFWAQSDSIYSRDGRIALDYYMTPSTVTIEHQELLRNVAKGAVIRHGLKDTFWNVELWYDGKDARITEVNPRSASVWHWFYEGAFNTSLYLAMMHLSVRNYDEVHKLAPNHGENSKKRLAMQFHVVTYLEGTAASLVNFDAVKAFPNISIEWLVTPDSVVRQEQTGGAIVARFEIYADDANASYQQAYTIRKAILRDFEMSPYDSSIDPILERDQILYGNPDTEQPKADTVPSLEHQPARPRQ